MKPLEDLKICKWLTHLWMGKNFLLIKLEITTGKMHSFDLKEVDSFFLVKNHKNKSKSTKLENIHNRYDIYCRAFYVRHQKTPWTCKETCTFDQKKAFETQNIIWIMSTRDRN